MLETFRGSALTMMLTAWSVIAVAQTSPGGTPGGATAPPAGTTSDAADGGMNWLWIIALIAVVAVLLFYFLGRGRSTRI
jgi:heme/copper-type cytochrome/quinol oxidase subunit 2